MKLKLFAAKRESGYSGGLIVVAANSIDEAYKTYIDWVESTGNPYCLYQRYDFGNGDVDVYNKYPRENWYEIPKIKIICDAPKVIDEGGYTE